MVHPDGEVLFIYPTVLRVACVADLTAWPYDVHNCSAKFGSWVHDGYTIDLEVHDDSPEVKVRQTVLTPYAEYTQNAVVCPDCDRGFNLICLCNIS